ncbi:MAG: MFS transporter [Chloroflexi bacterium]|nr:MFS transporter [Chloroflexota bacterium]
MDASVPQQVDKSLRYSIKDGSAYSAMLGLTQDYIIPFALALKATVIQVGLLSSVPNLVMAVSQLAAPQLAERAGSRKGLILPVVFLHALSWLPVVLIPYFFSENRLWWLLGFLTVNATLGALGNPAWGSMMADLVPEGIRGRYFGLRGKITGSVSLVFFFAGGAVLQLAGSDIFTGFAVLFGGAMAFRLLSWYFLSRMYEPPVQRGPLPQPSLPQIVKSLRSSNQGRFMVFVALMSFTTYIASPFFAVYMLRDLGFNYLTYVAINATAAVASLSFLRYWGRRADRAGNLKVIKAVSALIPALPLLWLVSNNALYLIPIQVVSGLAWAGFNLASTNFIYDATAPESRTRYIAVFNALNGTAICLGALLGGLLAPLLPALMGYKLLTLFVLSGLARSLVSLIGLRRIAEVRQVKEVCMRELLFGQAHGRVRRQHLPDQQSPGGAPSVHEGAGFAAAISPAPPGP